MTCKLETSFPHPTSYFFFEEKLEMLKIPSHAKKGFYNLHNSSNQQSLRFDLLVTSSKNKRATNPSKNYRPISLTPEISK